MDTATHQRLAVSALVGHCEGIAGSGALNEPAEKRLRKLIVATLSAFQMPTQAERATPLVVVGDHMPEPANLNISEAELDATQETLALILGGRS